jgi:hypothetical protein
VWRHHWDFQLYKALEVQFRAGLENINKSLPEVNSSRTNFGCCYVSMPCNLRNNGILEKDLDVVNTHILLLPQPATHPVVIVIRHTLLSCTTRGCSVAPVQHFSINFYPLIMLTCPHLQVEVSLVYKNKRLQYDLPLEVLRLQHFSRHLNGFLGLPLRMKGVSSLSERQGFFAPIADADPAAIARVSCVLFAICRRAAVFESHATSNGGCQDTAGW